MTQAVLRTDGGSRGNPGPAGVGFVIEDLSGTVLCSGGRYIGETTNNVAEYEALIWGLENARALGVDIETVYLDSELLVKQLNGEYRVKHPNMKPLYARTLEILSTMGETVIAHVMREDNKAADSLVNQALDTLETVGTPVHLEAECDQGTLFD